MRYDREGFPKLRKDCIRLSRTEEPKDGIPWHARFENHYLTMEELPDFLNGKLVDKGYIEEEVEI